MAIGDFVNGVAIAVDLTFQPAAGITICLTSAVSWQQSTRITNGVDYGYLTITNQVAGGQGGIQGLRVFIDNTNYVTMIAAPAGSCYSGIQVK